MLKYFVFLLMGLLFVGCGDSATTSTQDTNSKFLGIQRSSSSSQPVSINQKIVLNFTANILQETVTSSHIYIEYVPPTDPNYDSDEPPYPIGTYLGTGTSAKNISITPYSYLYPNSTYRVIVTTGVKDIYGRTLAENYIYYFNTQDDALDLTEIEIRATKPDNNVTDVFVDSEIVIDFNKDISAEAEYTATEYFEVVDSDGEAIAGRTEVFNSLLKFIPASHLPYDKEITVKLKSDIYDVYRNYFSSGYTWSFKTRSEVNSPDSALGYKVLDKFDTYKASYFVRTLSNAKDDSLVAVARQGAIDLYNINYNFPKSIPSIDLNSTFALDSQIILLETYYPFVLVGTINDGMYLLAYVNGTLVEHTHVDQGSSIYGVHLGKPDNSPLIPDKIYTTNPNTGLNIYDYNSTTSELSLFTTVSDSVVGKSLDVIDYVDQDRKIYVADYNGSVVTLDENGTFLSKVDMNGSVKQLFTMPNTKVYTVSSAGIINGVEYNGTLANSFRYDIPSAVNDSTVYSKPFSSYGTPYFATDRGFVIANDTNITHIVNSSVATASISIVNSFDIENVEAYNALFLVSLSKYGTLELFNAKYDDKAPKLDSENTYPNDGDQDVSASIDLKVAFDDLYLDESTLTKDKFTLFDVNSSSYVLFDFSTAQGESTSSTTAVLNPNEDLTQGHTYKIEIEANVLDMFGRKFNSGVDENISFTVE